MCIGSHLGITRAFSINNFLSFFPTRWLCRATHLNDGRMGHSWLLKNLELVMTSVLWTGIINEKKKRKLVNKSKVSLLSLSRSAEHHGRRDVDGLLPREKVDLVRCQEDWDTFLIGDVRLHQFVYRVHVRTVHHHQSFPDVLLWKKLGHESTKEGRANNHPTLKQR